MDENPHQYFGVRDLFWLTALAIVLALWGWDRGELAARINTMATPALQARRVVTGGVKIRTLPVTVDFAAPIGQER
jgi:hypothetical protein